MDPAVRRRRVIVILATFTAVCVVSVLVYLFAPATSFSPEALGYSVEGEATGNGGESMPCKRRDRGGWDCGVYNLGTSGPANYRIEMDGSRCWHGRRTSPGWDNDGELPREISGCLKVHDQLRVWDRVF
jgi:hypothetical protein